MPNSMKIMEQPPGSLDDLQPPDASTSNIPAVIDLTKKAEDRVLNSTSLNALRMVKSPGWYQNPGTANPGLQLSETGSLDVPVPSADQIQPDNAFSHTTVTLSYVSRSHVFSTHDSPSQHSPLYSVPPISKLSLHPHCDAENRVGAADRLQNQRYPEWAEEPVDLVPQADPFHSSSQAQVGLENDTAPRQNPLDFNGGFVSGGGGVKNPLEAEEQHGVPLANGGDENCSSPETLPDFRSDTPTTVAEDDEERDGSEVLFIMSKKQDSALAHLCSLTREFRSPLEDPVSPSATSLDDVEDVFVLPQASSSPSAGNSYLEAAEDAAGDSGTERVTGPGDENKRDATSEASIDLTEDARGSDPDGIVPHVNGNAETLERTAEGRKLPTRPGRGTRLEAIVMNINSSRYNVSGCILTSRKAGASQSARRESDGAESARKRRNNVKTTFSVKKVQRKALKVNKEKPVGKPVEVHTDSCKDSTSDSELINKLKKSRSRTPTKTARFTRAKTEPAQPPQTGTTKSKRKSSLQSSPQFTAQPSSKKQPDLSSHPEPLVQKLSPPKSPKNHRGETRTKLPGSEKSPSAKTKAARAPKRRRKKHKRSPSSSMFSPREPEIRLKYVSFKEDKKDSRSDGFSPFVRVERRQSSPSLCTVINYPEQVKMEHKSRQQQQQGHAGGFVPAAVPSTSCLQLGRPSGTGQHRGALVCCLCGQSANAIDLGDLHGPYYPEGYRPSAKRPASASGLKDDEDDSSDSDSSSCSVRARRRKCAVPPGSWTHRPGAPLKQKGRLESRRWTGDGADGPAAKRARSDGGSADVEDWYSPPVLPLEPNEFWLHEDCGIWSAGVYLVKGKVYGLEEAVKVAQETVCSACHDPGATLGCFFKGCPNKYHYRCALESDCVLIEENFSMKCKKHKNKTFKAPPGIRWDDR